MAKALPASERVSPVRAREVFDALCPDKRYQRDVVTFFADAIRTAHNLEPAAWEVSLFEDRVRLNVGQVEVLALNENALKFFFEGQPVLPESDGVSVEYKRGEPHYAAVPIESGAYHVDVRRVGKLPQSVRNAHNNFVESAASSKRVSPFKATYSEGVLLFLEEELKAKLPRPSYVASGEASVTTVSRAIGSIRKRESVLAAIREFDELGQEAFLVKYGFRPSRTYFLEHDGKRYDSKAIMGAAFGFEYPDSGPLTPAEFSGGENTVARRLRELGFKVVTDAANEAPISPAFVPGHLYRRRELHAQFGGQRQGGISTPANQPFIFLFTGDSGEQHGYQDGWTADGLFLYSGEGQRGDMEMLRGNAALKDHAENSKDLFLFEQAGKGNVRFVGQMVCTGHQTRKAPDTDGNLRDAIVFELTPLAEFSGGVGDDDEDDDGEDEELAKATLDELRKRALAGSSNGRSPVERKAQMRVRSRAIKLYVLKRSKGKCEGCEADAPFSTKAGTPYLEPHHIRRLSDGGPDHPRWVVAVCPNCHRRAHYADDSSEYNQRLGEIVGRLEAGQ